MGHVTLKEILSDTRERKYGIPCLLGGNLEMIVAQIRAAEDNKSPLIICFNKPLTPNVPMELAIPLIVNAASRASVPIATMLDHATEFDFIMKAIHYGISSVMFDGSNLPYEENVSKTVEVVRVAHALGVSVEAELGYVGGSALEMGDADEDERESMYTNPEQVLNFVKRTGIDAMAVSFGNVHGKYRGEPRLDLERVRKIAAFTAVPLSMHGGSGLNNEDYRSIIRSGISKINYYSSMSMGAGINMKMLTSAADPYPACHEIIEWTIEYFYEETKKLLDIMDCTGKAQLHHRAEDWCERENNLTAGKIAEIVVEVVKSLRGA